jgi:hypothetical protein
MNCSSSVRIAFALLCPLIGMAGCARAPSEAPTVPTPVTVSYPALRDVSDYADFTARTAGQARARAWARRSASRDDPGRPVRGDAGGLECDGEAEHASLDLRMSRGLGSNHLHEVIHEWRV